MYNYCGVYIWSYAQAFTKMILTYKVKHGRDFTKELKAARQVAEFAVKNPDKLSTKYVKHFGLKAAISNSILRKYGRDWKCKSVSAVKLAVCNYHIKLTDCIYIPCLKLTLPFRHKCEKVNQIEFCHTYAYIACTIQHPEPYEAEGTLGVDLNATSHCAVVAVERSGKVYKLGKQCNHIRNKYRSIRTYHQKREQFKVVKRIRNRESRIMTDINHKVSKSIVDIAVKNKCIINMEDLKGIRKAKTSKKFKGTLNSWSFYQLRTFIEYKAQKAGAQVHFVDPRYTSKCCSHCGLIGNRKGKVFTCTTCNHVDHADVNAGFNIACANENIVRLQLERDSCKGRTGKPQEDRVDGCTAIQSTSKAC